MAAALRHQRDRVIEMFVKYCELHAVVRREPEHEHSRDAVSPEEFTEAGCLAMPIVEETAVAVDARVRAFLEHALPRDRAAVPAQTRRQ